MTPEFKDDFDIEEPQTSSKKWIWTLLLLVLVVIVGFVIIKDPFGGSTRAKLGDTVTIAYTATYENGSIYKQRTEQDPLVFVLWSATVAEWVEDQLLSMKKWQTKDFVLTPEAWFAKYYDSSKKQIIPGIIFEQIWKSAESWAYYDLWNIAGTVVSIRWSGNDQKIVLDTNPLETRQNVSYHVHLLDIKK